MKHQREENEGLRRKYDAMQAQFVDLRTKLSNADEQENIRLKSTLDELNMKLQFLLEQK